MILFTYSAHGGQNDAANSSLHLEHSRSFCCHVAKFWQCLITWYEFLEKKSIAFDLCFFYVLQNHRSNIISIFFWRWPHLIKHFLSIFLPLWPMMAKTCSLMCSMAACTMNTSSRSAALLPISDNHVQLVKIIFGNNFSTAFDPTQEVKIKQFRNSFYI